MILFSTYNHGLAMLIHSVNSALLGCTIVVFGEVCKSASMSITSMYSSCGCVPMNAHVQPESDDSTMIKHCYLADSRRLVSRRMLKNSRCEERK